ncbi:hypothetical protein SAMN05421819_1514 [Bryocella elongata]|uniref:PXPV repeat-containing protein n=1 Tax=Bryocella elongata TaxID=863522 RepID=A0A1H5WCA7_9BACT|nr:hypothetical protein [Bryocella elongata]SEF97010.1 hypothetical protein SAMN05421819_1514 [Bryocella elongata]
MKLATVANILRTKVARGAAVAALAAGTLAVAAPAAQAQRFFVGVGVGPRYVAPRPVYVAPQPYYAAGPAVVYGGPAYGYGYYDRFHGWHRDYGWHRGYEGRWHR